MLTDDFLSYLRFELNRSALTVEAYSRDINSFIQWLSPDGQEKFMPADVARADIRAWLSTLAREGDSPRTLRRKAQSLRAFFKFLLKKGIVEANPTSDITLPKIPHTLPDNIRAEEVERILHAGNEELAEEPENEDEMREFIILEILYTLGLRRAELISLNDNDINFPAAEIKVTGKRSKQRIVPVPEALLSHIARWQRLRDTNYPSIPAPVPLIVMKGKRISPSQVYSIVKRALAATSARRRSPHALRHTFATAMLNEGADLNSVKEFLGHSSLATTQIYTHISFAEMKKAYGMAHPRARKKEE